MIKFSNLFTVKPPYMSIIIPCYNCNETIQQCLESILNQTYNDFEIICIDDCSTDNTFNILSEIKKTTDKIKIIRNKTNLLAGYCRNIGIRESHGKYIIFVDSDDFLELNALEKIKQKTDLVNPDICLFRIDKYDQQTKQHINPYHVLKTDFIETDKNYFSYKTCKNIFTVTIPGPYKCFNRDFVVKNNLWFQENLHNTNDLSFTLTALTLANKIAYVNDVVYHYRVNQKNSTQTNKSKYLIDFFNAIIKLYLNVKNRFSDYQFETNFYEFLYQMLSSNYYTYNENAKKEFVKYITTPEFKQIYDFPPYLIMTQNIKTLFSRVERIIFNQMNTNNKITIVIPTYNSEKTLDDCLNSIQKQSYKNLEIICVDDCSTDKTISILEQYSKNDSRIKILKNQENLGPGPCRDQAIEIATGKFIMFCDSDDQYQNQNIIEKMVNKFIDGIDVVGGNIRWLRDGNIQPVVSSLMPIEFNNKIYLYQDTQEIYFYQRYMFRLNLICKNNIRFKNYRRFQDPHFLVECMHYATKFIGLSDVVYIQRTNDHYKNLTLQQLKDRFIAMHDLIDYTMDNNYLKAAHSTISQFINSCSHSVIDIIKNDEDLKTIVTRNILQILSFGYIVDNEYISKVLHLYFNINEINYQQISEDKVSIIIPVYNVENYLKKCLNSIIHQSYTNIEIICIDDNSTDNSLDILTEYSNLDKRIKVIHNHENIGLGFSRNVGLLNSTSKYVVFVDSDDYIELNSIEKIVEQMSKTDAEICLYKYINFSDNDSHVQIEYKSNLCLDLIESNQQIFSFKTLKNKNIFDVCYPAVWSKAFSRHFIFKNKLFFSEIRYSEDIPYTYYALAIANRITFVNAVLYMYLMDRKDSLRQIGKNDKLMLKACFDLKTKLKTLPYYDELKENLNNKLLNWLSNKNLIDLDDELLRKIIKQETLHPFRM